MYMAENKTKKPAEGEHFHKWSIKWQIILKILPRDQKGGGVKSTPEGEDVFQLHGGADFCHQRGMHPDGVSFPYETNLLFLFRTSSLLDKPWSVW